MKWNSHCIGNGLAGVMIFVGLGSARAGEHDRSGKVETSGGRDATFQQEIHRGKDSQDRSTTVRHALLQGCPSVPRRTPASRGLPN